MEMKKLALILMTMLIVLFALTGNVGAAVSGEPELEQQMLELVNNERVKAGLKPLEMDNKLLELARLKSQDMIDKNYFSHTSPTYGDPFTMMKNFGVEYWMAGENLAGNSSLTSAHKALMNSPGHKANILKPEFTHIGIGVVKGGPYGMMITQMFIKSRNEVSTPDTGDLNLIQPVVPSHNQNTGNKDLKIVLKNKEVSFPDIKPFINKQKRVMVPIRFISQNMGYKVDWEKLDQKIIIKNHENIMNLWVGKNILFKNNQIFLSDTYPELHNGRTMVPLRLISELMGYEVVWDSSFNKVEIKLH